MDSLAGSLSVLSLPALLQVLADERRSGRLDVRAEDDAVLAVLWLDEGSVVHAQGQDGSDDGDGHHGRLVASVMGRDEGTFRFVAGEAPPKRTGAFSAGELLLEAARLSDHASRVSDGLASDVVVALAPIPASVSTPRFNTLQWRLLASIDGQRDVAALSAELGLPLAATAALLEELLAAGVLEAVDA